MQQSQPSAVNQSHSPLVGNIRRPSYVFTRKRVSFMAGALLFITIIAIANADMKHRDTESQLLPTHNAASTGKSTNAAENDISASGTDPPPAQNKTQVNVNGQNIPVPTQGSTSSTTVNGNSQTTINISNSSSSTQSSSGASSSNTLNLNVNSSSDSTSGSVN